MAFTITTQHDDQYEPKGGPLQPGFYPAMVFEYTETQTRNPNRETGLTDPMIVLTLGVYADENHEKKHLHTECKYYLVIREKMQWKVERALKVCGNKFGQGDKIVLNERMFTGKRIAVRTSIKISDRGGRFLQIDDLLSRDKVPHWGAMTDDERAEYNIDADGVADGNNVTRKSRPARDYREPAPTAPAANSYDNLAEDDFEF